MDNQLEKLERLARLRDQGALTPEEFLAEKARLLGTGDMHPTAQYAEGELNAAPPRSPLPRHRHRAIIVGASVMAFAALGGSEAYYVMNQPETPAPNVPSSPTPLPNVAIASPPPIPATPEPLPLALEDDLRFTDPANCKASAATDSLFNRLLTPPNGDVANISTKAINVGADRREVRPVLTKLPGENIGDQLFEGIADFPQPARWHGLRVRGVSASLYVVPEADSTYTRQIRFLDDPAAVRAGLNKQGFAVPLSPQYAQLNDDACGGSMQITSAPGGSALQCSWGC